MARSTPEEIRQPSQSALSLRARDAGSRKNVSCQHHNDRQSCLLGEFKLRPRFSAVRKAETLVGPASHDPNHDLYMPTELCEAQLRTIVTLDLAKQSLIAEREAANDPVRQFDRAVSTRRPGQMAEVEKIKRQMEEWRRRNQERDFGREM